MDIGTKISEIQNKLASNEIKTAIQLSMDLARNTCTAKPQVLHNIIIISSNFSKLHQDSAMMLTTSRDEEFRQRSQFMHQLLTVLDQIQGSARGMA